MSADFPATWRYVPLKLTKDRTKWVNAISYRKLADEHGLGEFYGVDVEGDIHFENEILKASDGDGISGGIASVNARNGWGVGIFMRYSQPRLVIIDCDSDLETVVEGSIARFKLRRGRDQLVAMFKRHGEEIPPCPAVRGSREGHGYLIFRQNSDHPILRRKIRPFGLSLDVLGAGHQNHWTCGNRELVAGRELLDNPPELPAWLAQLILKDKPSAGVERGTIDTSGANAWSRMFIDAVLVHVSSTGPGWNQNLFNAACTLAENGFSWPRIKELIIDRCEPDNPTEEMVALNSIGSAWRKVTGEAVPE